MKKFITIFISFSYFFSQIYGQKFCHNPFYTFPSDKFKGKYTKGELNLRYKKSNHTQVFTQSGDFPSIKTDFRLKTEKSLIPFPKNTDKKIKFAIAFGQRSYRTLSFSGLYYVNEVYNWLLYRNLPQKLAPIPLLMAQSKIYENRIGISMYPIIRNDYYRYSNMMSNEMSDRIRPYSAINQRNTFILIGVKMKVFFIYEILK